MVDDKLPRGLDHKMDTSDTTWLLTCYKDRLAHVLQGQTTQVLHGQTTHVLQGQATHVLQGQTCLQLQGQTSSRVTRTD